MGGQPILWNRSSRRLNAAELVPGLKQRTGAITQIAASFPRVWRDQIVGAIVDHKLAIVFAAVLDREGPDGRVVHHPVAEEFGRVVQTCVALPLNH